jgi:glycosyltransferase involved in cell wall biosynthesis
MAKISLVMIVKDEEYNLRRCVDSVKSIVDEFVIVDTGSTDNTKNIIAEYGQVFEIPFEDFVTTKNKALEMATGDYILFMDADEFVIDGIDNLKDFAERGQGDAISALIVEGNDTTIYNQYHRFRLWKNKPEFRFIGPGCHEVIDIGNGKTFYDKSIRVRHVHDKPGKDTEAKERINMYVRLLSDAVEKNPQDSRAWFYLARTFLDAANYYMAIQSYKKYISIEGNQFTDERWQAYYDMAKAYKAVGEYDAATRSLFAAIHIDERRAEAFTLAGVLAYNRGDFKQAIDFFEKAISTPIPETTLFLDPTMYSQVPADYLVVCYDKTGDKKRAAMMALKTLATSVPVSSNLDERKLKNVLFYARSEHKKIFMALGDTPEPLYAGVLYSRGAGGVETAFIELSTALARLGHEVFLFCKCDKPHTSNGVYYVPFQRMQEYSAFDPDIMISSRWTEPFIDGNWNRAKKIFWFQDAIPCHTADIVANNVCDQFVCSSTWHRDFLLERFSVISPEKLHIVPLGIDHALFAQTAPKDRWKAVYSSSPDRGLFDLFDMWGDITTALPKIHLSVFYGINHLKAWNTDHAWQKRINQWIDRCDLAAKKYGNIRFTERLPKRQLADEIQSASICLYPCNFHETFCITALEMQAAGVVSVSSGIGALCNTYNRFSNVLIDEPVGTREYRSKFVESTIDIMSNTAKLSNMGTACRQYGTRLETSWKTIAEKWEGIIDANR